MEPSLSSEQSKRLLPILASILVLFAGAGLAADPPRNGIRNRPPLRSRPTVESLTNGLQGSADLIRRLAEMAGATLAYGRHPLHVAASRGEVDLVDALLRQGVDPNLEGNTLDTANHQLTGLEVAIWYGHSNVVARLLAAGTDLDHCTRPFGSALHIAFLFGSDNRRGPDRHWMAGQLLDHGADPFLEDHRKQTPFELAITRGDGRLVPRMLTNAAASGFLEQRGARLLALAVERRQIEAVAALLQHGVPAVDEAHARRPLLQVLALGGAGNPDTALRADDRRDQIRARLETAGARCDAFSATGLGDTARVREILRDDPQSTTARDPDGQTPLHWAVRTDQLAMTQFWLDAGTQPATTNAAGQTPLHLAAATGLADHLQLLIAAHAPLGLRDTNGLTPLDAAIQAKQTAAIRALLKAGAPGTSGGRGISTPLHYAVETGSAASVEAALGAAPNLNALDELGATALHRAVKAGNLVVAAQLLAAGADVNACNAEGNTPLHVIFEGPLVHISARPPPGWYERIRQEPRVTRFLGSRNDPPPIAVIEAARFLLAHGADPAVTNRAGLTSGELVMQDKMLLFEDERPALLRLLDRRGGDVDAADSRGETMLHRAARDLDPAKAESLIASGADVNAKNLQGRTPLHAAVEHIRGWPAPLVEILKGEPKVNIRDDEGLTALHVLAQSQTTFMQEAAAALLEAGADPKVRDEKGRTPLHGLLTGGRAALDAEGAAALLLAAGADPNAADAQGRTPLHAAAALSVHELFALGDLPTRLLGLAIQLDAQDRDGNTPLHLAAKSGNHSFFSVLVQRGARLDITNAAGETPRMLAARDTDGLFKAFLRLPPGEDLFQLIASGDEPGALALIDRAPGLVTASDPGGRAPLLVAAMRGHTHLASTLVQRGAPWDPVSAALLGRGDVLARLLAQNPAAVTNAFWGKRLLHFAAESGSETAVQVVLQAGGDLRVADYEGLSPLGRALLKDRPAVAELLRRHGAEENLFDAVHLDKPERLAALLKQTPALLRATNGAGLGVGHAALMLGRDLVFQQAIDCGLSPDSVVPSAKLTLLHVAACWNRTNAVATLLEHGAAMDSVDSAGYSPLHYAARYGAVESVILLLDHGANPRAPTARSSREESGPWRNEGGDTSLHVAAMHGQTNVLRLLVSRGCPVNVTNRAGNTARQSVGRTSLLPFEQFPPRPFGLLPPLNPGGPMHRVPVRNEATLAVLDELEANTL